MRKPLIFALIAVFICLSAFSACAKTEIKAGKNSGNDSYKSDTGSDYFNSLSIDDGAESTQSADSGGQSAYTPSPEDEALIITINGYIDGLLSKTPSYIPYWSKEGFKNRWNYIDGVFMQALTDIYERTDDGKYKDFFINYINYYVYPAGQYDKDGCKFKSPQSSAFGSTPYNKGELDSVCESRILFDAYDYTGDQRYIEAIEYTYSQLCAVPMAGDSGCYSHKATYLDQVWLDGFYMYAPFYTRYALMKNDGAMTDTLAAQYKFVYDNMRDGVTGLYYHGLDTTRSQNWADKTTGLSKSFWLRAFGWLVASLADVLEYYPAGDNKVFLSKMLSEALESVLVFRDEQTKMYYNVIDLDPETPVIKGRDTVYNYLETSGSALISYAMLKAAYDGNIDGEFAEKGAETFNGICDYSLEINESDVKLNHILVSAGLGGNGNRDGTAYYYLTEEVASDEAKGVGPFIMAYNYYLLTKYGPTPYAANAA